MQSRYSHTPQAGSCAPSSSWENAKGFPGVSLPSLPCSKPFRLPRFGPGFFGEMDIDYDSMAVVQLRALARERGLRGYVRLRKAELIAILLDNLGRGMLKDPDLVEGLHKD